MKKSTARKKNTKFSRASEQKNKTKQNKQTNNNNNNNKTRNSCNFAEQTWWYCNFRFGMFLLECRHFVHIYKQFTVVVQILRFTLSRINDIGDQIDAQMSRFAGDSTLHGALGSVQEPGIQDRVEGTWGTGRTSGTCLSMQWNASSSEFIDHTAR